MNVSAALLIIMFVLFLASLLFSYALLIRKIEMKDDFYPVLFLLIVLAFFLAYLLAGGKLPLLETPL